MQVLTSKHSECKPEHTKSLWDLLCWQQWLSHTRISHHGFLLSQMQYTFHNAY